MFLGVDLGTSSVKLLLADGEGRILGQRSTEYPISYPYPHWSEQNPEDWWNGFCRALAALGAAHRLDRVTHMSFSGQMHGLVLLDEEDKVIRPALLWNDGRTADECDYLNGEIGKEKLIAWTGNVALAGFTAPKVLWVRRHEPENFSRAARLMLPKDYIAYRLTGAFATDVSDASGTLFFDVKNRRWSQPMESKGFTVAVYNRTASKVQALIEGRAKGKNIIGAYSLEELVSRLKKPRKVMMLVKAGQAVDDFIEALIPLLDAGDILIDGGNSHFPDTIRRTVHVEGKGLLYIGTGVSGGEEGALKGPSMMPGGSPAGWAYVKPIFQAVCAKADGAPCCDWVGENGAGHFVKMVHNGIEYGDMQLICEAYHLMRDVLGMTADQMHEVFKAWNGTELNSYLIEITADILAHKDADGAPIVDKILDAAGQKGTGKWTGIAALDEGVPLTLIGEAVFARSLSAMKEERVLAAAAFPKEKTAFTGDRAAVIEQIRQALYASKIISYAQGYALMRAAAKTYGWSLNYGGIALMWRGGCIIRSAFLGKIKEAFDATPGLSNLLLDPYFKETILGLVPAWRSVVLLAVQQGIPVPAFSSALSYFDGYTTEKLPANLLQAQRDYFGAHTYERTDKNRGEFFHTNWTGEGGSTAATTYNA
ncbi:MAG: decarboxylating NADP(+)-dependent phosphogluconate dehydrogenase [Clostridiaceae bacterium]